MYGSLDGPGLPPVLPSYDVETVVVNGLSCCYVSVCGWEKIV